MRSRQAAVLVVASALSAAVAAQQFWTVDAITVTEPRTVATLEGNWMKGQAASLAWSPDGKELYFGTLDGAFGKADAKRHHHVITIADGKRRDAQVEPAWATEYWLAKSGQASPDDATYKIELKSEQRTEKAVSVPRGGDLARGGTVTSVGSSADEGVQAALNSQIVFMNSMLLHKQVVGYFENSVIVPGLTFGWGPKGSKVIAYVAKDGEVIVMDATGARKPLPGSKDALLPAWSPDGSKIAWLQKDGRRKYLVKIAGVAKS